MKLDPRLSAHAALTCLLVLCWQQPPPVQHLLLTRQVERLHQIA